MNAVATVIASAPVATRFIDNGDGTVTDQTTNLMWSKDTLSKKCIKHATAEKTCAELDLAGHKDWRLPTPHELVSLVDYARHSPAIDTTRFPDTKTDWYWSSTSYAASPDCAWIVSFGDGFLDNYRDDDNNAFVRAVRSVPSSQ